MTTPLLPFEPTVTVFMLVKTSPEWLGFPVDRRFVLLAEHFTPIVKKHAASVALRFFDVEFYSTRVTDIWMWDAADHHSYQLLVEDLRETAFWDRYFDIVEILTGVENAYAKTTIARLSPPDQRGGRHRRRLFIFPAKERPAKRSGHSQLDD